MEGCEASLAGETENATVLLPPANNAQKALCCYDYFLDFYSIDINQLLDFSTMCCFFGL